MKNREKLKFKSQIKSYILFFICFSFSFQALGKTYNMDISFEPISTENGLLSNEIRKLYQDKEGYLWIATYGGLTRYDGYNFVVYKNINNQGKHSINSFVNSIVEDFQHNLWIATLNGLYILNKSTGIIIKVDFPILENCRIETIVPSRNGDVWIATNRGMFCRLALTGKFEYCTGSKWNLDPTDMKTLLEDKNGYLWIGTWESSLIRYDIKQRKAYRYSSIGLLRSSHTLFQDNNNNIWIGTWGQGLVKLINPYDMNHLSYVNYQHQANNESSLLDNIIYTIAQDHNTGKIWIGSRSGLSILNDPDDPSSFSNYMPEVGQKGLPFNEVNSIICTRDNLMWLGLLGGGVYCVNTGQSLFKKDPLLNIHKRFGTSSIKSICADNDGILWMGIAGFGLVSYNRNNGQFNSHKELAEFKETNSISTVNAIELRKKTNEMCFATWDDGIWFYNKQKHQLRVMNTNTVQKMVDNCVYAFLEDSNNNFWIGTRSGVGILFPNEKYIPLNELLAPNQKKMSQCCVFHIVEDHKGNIWIATNDKGIFRIEQSKQGKIIHNYSPENNRLSTEGVLSLYVDHQNRIWAGTESEGLMLYNSEKDYFVPFDHEIHLRGNVVSNILEDKNHHLWITTNAGIMEFLVNKENKLVFSHNYTVNDGLLDNYYNRNACFSTTDGEILFGGYHGISSISFKKRTNLIDNSPIAITDFKIFNKSLRNFDIKNRKKISKQTIEFTDKVILTYDKNNFNVDFSLLNYVNPSQNRYAYKLDGYDEDWVYADAERHFAYYNNLSSGTYFFHVRGANSNNVWSSQEKVLQITILPPPWLTLWAYCIYFLFVVFAAAVSYRIVRNRVIMKQALELGEIKRQKIEEVNYAKLQFFTNITHELLTPLTIISASIEQLKQSNPSQSNEYGLIMNNVVKLMRLIQQILDFRKAESGKLKLKVSEGDLTLFLENCVKAFQPLAKKQKLNFIFQSEERNIISLFDPDKVDKIMYNLLSNAAKYNKENGSVWVSLKQNNEHSHVIIAVRDSGDGMTQEEINHIFQLFYEGDYRKHHTIGNGIGLSLVKNLVDVHHGTIEVQSIKNEGSTFIVTLPVMESAYPENEIDHTIEIINENIFNIDDDIINTEDSCDEIREIEKVTKILIVEDNEELLELLKKLLQTEYTVCTASNGKEAIKTLDKEESVNLIVSDVMMPEMDGYELCSFVKNQFEYSHIPVILLTAKRTDEDVIAGYESGADGYVTKPLNLALLQARIRNLLKKQQRMVIDFRKQLVFEAKELNYTSIDEKFIQQAIDCVNKHLDNCNFDQTQFVNEMGTSRTSLTEKLKSLTGLTPLAFINNIRLNAACRILDEKGKVRVSDLAFAVGFNDSKYFSTCFKKRFGLSPSEYVTKNKK